MAPRPPVDLARALHREVVREVARCRRAREAFLADGDAAALHRLRVTLRRLRALARLARPFLRPPAGLTERAFRRAGRSLAPLRDHDVALATLRAAATRAGTEERELLGAALDQLLRRRKEVLRQVRREVKGADELFVHLDRWGERPRGTAAGKAGAERGVRALARGVAERLLADGAWGRRVKGHGDPPLHRLRRRVRRARYQLEALAQILGREAPRTMLWLVQIQDALGQVQDVGAGGGVLRGSRRGRAALATGSLKEWGDGEGGRGAAAWERLRAGRVAWKRGVGRELGERAGRA